MVWIIIIYIKYIICIPFDTLIIYVFHHPHYHLLRPIIILLSFISLLLHIIPLLIVWSLLVLYVFISFFYIANPNFFFLVMHNTKEF